DYGGAVAFGFLNHASNLPLSFGQDLIGISVTFVDLAFAILTGLDGVVKGCLNLLWRLHVLNCYSTDLNTGLIAVKNALGQSLHFGRDLGTTRIQHEIH